MIVTSDIQFLMSAPQAGAGYTKPGVPGNSLGLYVSTTQLSATLLNNLWPDITGAQNAADQIDYQCLFVYNNNADHTMINPVAWLPSALLGAQNSALFAVGADLNPPTILGSSAAQAAVIANPTQAPSGVTAWASPSATSAGGVPLPNIPARYCAAIWLRRTASGGAGLNQFTVDVTFDTLS
jgi:hypothetical protein